MSDSTESALIVGAGAGLSAALARRCHADGMTVALAARRTDKLEALRADLGAHAFACDASDADSVNTMFDAAVAAVGVPDLVVYNPSARVRGTITDIDPEAVRKALMVTCYGGFLVAQLAARAMQARGSGTIIFTGASAGVKGFAHSATFAMGKFGLRGLAESMARELHPQNIHIGHFVIDGAIRKPDVEADGGDAQLDADAIAESYLQFHRQHRSAWAHEVALRPWVERF